MRPAFAAQLEFPGLVGVEQHHRLDAHAAVLGAAKAEDVDARFPRHFGRGAVQRVDGIGKTRAVQMDGQVEFAGHGGQGAQLVQRIDLATFGHLSDADGAALWPVHTARLFACDGRVQRLGGHLVAARYQRQLGAACIEFGGVAFVFVDVGDVAAKDGGIRGGVARQRQRVGGGACGNKEHFGLGRLERAADGLSHLVHHRIVAIGHGVARVVLHHAVHDLRMNGAGVVRGKKHLCGFLDDVVFPVFFGNIKFAERPVLYAHARIMYRL